MTSESLEEYLKAHVKNVFFILNGSNMFLPTQNAFERYGFDFMFVDDACFKLLEMNSGLGRPRSKELQRNVGGFLWSPWIHTDGTVYNTIESCITVSGNGGRNSKKDYFLSS